MSNKTKHLVFVFVVAFAFSSSAMAIDIAISTQANWWGQGAADREMQEIVDNVTSVSVEQFPVDQQEALASWVEDHTGDGAPDLLILCGAFPDTIYEPGNGQADDSIAELFLDDGNTIIMVTHEDDIAQYAHRVVKLRDGLIELDEPNVSIARSAQSN